MHIEYIGHACFYLTLENGTRILIDPYDPSIGLSAFTREADAVLVTHGHYDHAYLDAVTGNYKLIDGAGQRTHAGAHFIGLSAPHDNSNGSKRGFVTTYIIEADGMRILHLGDMGGVPSEEYLQSIGDIDILLIPIGGTYTLDAAAAARTAELIGANITIPMHYKTKHLNLDIDTPHEFMELMKKECDISRLGSNKFDIDAASLKKRRRVLFMENAYGGA